MRTVSAICLYCGASVGNDPRYRALAAEMGRALAARGIEMVFGGGHVGLMGAAADAALAAGGRVTGVIPHHLVARELGHASVTELVEVDSMHERKQCMFDRSDAFVALPGGVGTLDETLEVITWKQLGMHDKPIVLLDYQRYWSRLIALVEGVIAEGFAPPSTARLYSVARSVEEVFAAIEEAPESHIRTDTEKL